MKLYTHLFSAFFPMAAADFLRTNSNVLSLVSYILYYEMSLKQRKRRKRITNISTLTADSIFRNFRTFLSFW